MLDDLKFLHNSDKSDVLGILKRNWPDFNLLFADVSVAKNPAKKLAQEMLGKAVAIECAPEMLTVAVAWRKSIAVQAKHLAWISPVDVTDLSYVIGWSAQPPIRPVGIFRIRSNAETDDTKNLYKKVDKFLSGKRPFANEVVAPKNIKDEKVYLAAFGDFAACYLALLNGVDPADNTLYNKIIN